MANDGNARTRILALERLRVVETDLITASIPLIHFLEEDLTSHLGSEVPASLKSRWRQGEAWWPAANPKIATDDPRQFPVLLGVIEEVEQISGKRWRADPAGRGGIHYQDLIEPLRRLLDERTSLATIAGVPH